MDGNQLKQKVKDGGVVYGTMLTTSTNPRWAKPITAFGLDYVIIDTEHAPQGRSAVAEFLTAFSLSGVVPIVRIPIPDAHYATMAIDAGAHGVLAPYCETVEEVKSIVAAVKWRPLKGALARKAVDADELPSEETREYLQKQHV